MQVMHFRSAHGCDPVEWVNNEYGAKLNTMYLNGLGISIIADEYKWLKPDMVLNIIDSRGHQESLRGDNNPMNRTAVAENFTGEDNPSNRPAVRDKISEALDGHEVSEETRQKISETNTGNEISQEHREAIAEAAEADRSYTQTEEYRQKLSEALKGRAPTFPEPYGVEELSHMVRSSWEEALGELLCDENINYNYEQEFELSDGSYYPDFTVVREVIEVKGWAKERAVEQVERFMELFPSYRYIVVGTELPCDIHILWEYRKELREVFQ